MMIATLAALWLFTGETSADPATSVEAGALVGEWTCHGYFVKSGRSLDATIAIARSDISNTLVVDHRDVAPGSYHSLELWSWTQQGVRAAVTDETGMRWFDGRSDAGSVTLTRDVDGRAFERFVYRPMDGTLNIDWLHRGPDDSLVLGDRLSCKR